MAGRRRTGGRARLARLAYHGKTFHWAGKLLGERQLDDAAILYDFCRWADDLVDSSPTSQASARLASLRQQFDVDWQGSRDPRVGAFQELAARRHFSDDTLRHFLDALAGDAAGAVRFTSSDALIRYAYGVASTVGLWMCSILGVGDPRAAHFAIDLGIAMQLTNVCRDVLEDAGRDRIYLPFPGHVTAEGLASDHEALRSAVEPTIRSTLWIAERYYRSADEGLRFLPLRARAAILVASRLYQAIGRRIDGHARVRLAPRCFVPRPAKAWLTLRAFGALALHPRFRSSRRAPPHDRTLHLPLAPLFRIDVCGSSRSAGLNRRREDVVALAGSHRT